MAIFPDQMKKSTLTIETIMGRLFSYRDLAHKFHLMTQAESQHEALDGLYKGVQDLQDSIIEQLIGYTNVRPDLKVNNPVAFSIDKPMILCNELISFASELIRFADENSYHNISNLAQELSGLAAHTKYFLYMSEYKALLK